MAVKNTRLGGIDWIDGSALESLDLNDTFDAVLHNSSVVERTSGDVTTTSSSFVDVTDMTITKTTGANRVLLVFTGTGRNTIGWIQVQFNIDGVGLGETLGNVIARGGQERTNMSMSYLTDVLTAASHTFKLQFAINAAGMSEITANTTTTPARFAVIEVMD